MRSARDGSEAPEGASVTSPSLLGPPAETPDFRLTQLVREPALSCFTLASLVPVPYLIALLAIARWIATRRMTRMLLN